MKIAYSAFLSEIGRENGVLKKILSQMRVWSEAGHEVRLFAMSYETGPPWRGLSTVAVDAELGVSMINLPWKSARLRKRMHAWRPDLVFDKFSLYYPAMERTFAACPVIGEMNTDDVQQRALGPLHLRLFNHLTRKRFLCRVAAFDCVTHELQGRYTEFEKPTFVSGNGIDLARVPPLPPTHNKTPRLIFLGYPHNPWGGVDKIVVLARHFPQWQFDIVGFDADDMPNCPPHNVVTHGRLDQRSYQRVLQQADVGIGSLALHRTGLNEASSLKVRQYLAAGIPAILANRDTDFTGSPSFLLQLPNVGDNIPRNLRRIEDFVHKWIGKRIPREAVSHLDIRFKEQERLDFFERIVSDWSANHLSHANRPQSTSPLVISR